MRSIISRILLFLLVVTLVVVAIRTVGDPSGLVSLEDIGPDELDHQAFRVTSEVRLAIDASGSIETAGADTTVLAALPWISRRSDGDVVWQMPARRPDRGTYVSLRDTITLEPGLYDAYLSTYGDPTVRVVERGESLGGRVRSVLSGEGRAWHGDARRWKLIVSVLSGEATHNVRSREDEPEWTEDESTLWRSGPVRSRNREEVLLRVGSPSELAVRAMGEVVDGVVRDSAYVVRLPEQDTVWVFTEGDWAGGASMNRRTRATVALEPGLYRAVYESDQSHAWRDWTATPPWAPWMWGLDLSRQPDADIVLFTDADPAGLPIISQFDCVGPDAELEDVFTLPEATTVILKGVGEISRESAYDWGELKRPSGETLFRMTRETTEPAGGTDRNRKATEILSLEAGTYILRYVSDGSHHCDSFSGDEPRDESLWGIAVYALDPSYDVAAVSHQRTSASGGPMEIEAIELPRSQRPPGEILARLDRIGNGADVSARFRLTAPDTLRVVALGELIRSERLDYGWIENEQGETVWEMTRGSSEPGGGADKNRRVDATLALGAGTYTVHFVTNGRHAFGAFDGTPPDTPEEWGIRVERVPRVEADETEQNENDVEADV
ncbi:MAG: hypothetical protein AAF170_05065 [Bacteroidota bacterium]